LLIAALAGAPPRRCGTAQASAPFGQDLLMAPASTPCAADAADP